MSCVTLTLEVWKRLVTTSTAVHYEWFTDWMPAAGMDKVKFVIKVKASSGSATFEAQPAIQTAAVRTNVPDSPTTCGATSQGGDGESVTSSIDISATTGPKYFVRFGVAYKVQAAGEAQADVSLQVCAETFGKIISIKTATLLAPDTSTYYQPLTGWMPTSMVSKFKAAFIIQNPSADFRCALAWQFASTSVQQPGSWSNSGTWYSSGEQGTGEVSATPGSNEMWVRAGIACKSNSASNVNATVTASVAIRK